MVSKKGARIQARCIIIPIAWIDARFLTAQVEIFLLYHGQHSLLDRMQDRKTGSP